VYNVTLTSGQAGINYAALIELKFLAATSAALVQPMILQLLL
jgi:hypothetical protein